MNDEDYERVQFLERLSRSILPLTEWEARFIDDILEVHIAFTQRMRDKIDQMRKRYECDL